MQGQIRSVVLAVRHLRRYSWLFGCPEWRCTVIGVPVLSNHDRQVWRSVCQVTPSNFARVAASVIILYNVV